MRAHRLGAVAWLAQPLYLVAELATVVAVTAPYRLADNTISDLGASSCTMVAYPFGDVPVCSPWHPVLNTALVVTGVLMAAGAVLIRHPVAGGPARWLWFVAGLSSIGTGVVPLDRDLDLHVLVSLPALVAMPLALLVTGVRLRRPARTGDGRHAAAADPALRAAGVIALVAGVVCLAGAVAFVVRAGEPDLGGAFERLALWPGYPWLAVAGVIALRRPADPSGPGRRREPTGGSSATGGWRRLSGRRS